jgi:hypothetical protein
VKDLKALLLGFFNSRKMAAQKVIDPANVLYSRGRRKIRAILCTRAVDNIGHLQAVAYGLQRMIY